MASEAMITMDSVAPLCTIMAVLHCIMGNNHEGSGCTISTNHVKMASRLLC